MGQGGRELRRIRPPGRAHRLDAHRRRGAERGARVALARDRWSRGRAGCGQDSRRTHCHRSGRDRQRLAGPGPRAQPGPDQRNDRHVGCVCAGRPSSPSQSEGQEGVLDPTPFRRGSPVRRRAGSSPPRVPPECRRHQDALGAGGRRGPRRHGGCGVDRRRGHERSDDNNTRNRLGAWHHGSA